MPFLTPARKLALARAARASAAIGGGAMLAAAYPPFQSPELAWGALAPFLLLARYSPPRQAFRWGFAGGLIFWLATLAWLLRLAKTGGPPVLVAVGWVLLSAYCALYIGAFCFVSAGLFAPERAADGVRPAAPARAGIAPGALRNLRLLVILPLLWTGLEYLRGTLFSGFPWNGLGVSQFRNLAVIQVAEWGGVYAVSAVVALLNVSLTLTALRVIGEFRGAPRARLHPELMVGLGALALCLFNGAPALSDRGEKPADLTIRVAAIQPAIPQEEKWTADTADGVYDALAGQTDLVRSLGRMDLVVWPETAVPALLPDDAQAREFVRQMSTGTVALLVGAMTAAGEGSATRYYNSSLLYGEDGKLQAAYHKRHLVPFGEYVPLEQVLPFLQKFSPLGFSCAAGATSTVFRLPETGAPFSALICFEDAFPWPARASVRRGARFLVNQTNDAWFDGSAAPVQHMSHCVFRCVENRVPAVRAANSGVTCFINRWGRIEDQASLMAHGWKLGVPGFTAAPLAIDADAPPSFYTRHGDLPFALPAGVAAAAAVALMAAQERRRRRGPAPESVKADEA